MKRRILALAASFCLLVPLAMGSAHAEDAPVPEAESLLFVFEGRDVTVKPIAGDRGSFTFRMPITQSNKRVTWFTDRPDRDAGRMTMDSLVALWQDDEADGFKNEPPNAALTIGEKVVVATMTNPRITENKDGDQSLVAKMTLVNADKLSDLAGGDSYVAKHAQRVDGNTRPATRTLPLVSVFVDTSNCDTIFNPCPLW